MAIYCEFIDLIIPISKIDEVYPSGFLKYKEDNLKNFSGRFWHDEFLFRDGAMSPMEIKDLCDQWESLGLHGFIEFDGQKHWKDFCVVESMFGGPTLQCDWLEYNKELRCVYLKGKPMGEIKGPNR